MLKVIANGGTTSFLVTITERHGGAYLVDQPTPTAEVYDRLAAALSLPNSYTLGRDLDRIESGSGPVQYTPARTSGLCGITVNIHKDDVLGVAAIDVMCETGNREHERLIFDAIMGH
jgi:hypothetical protein